MPAEVDIRCRCGTLQAVVRNVSGSHGNRAVCYCDDCQAFVHFLGRTDLLDAHGGTSVFQVSPANFRVTAGASHLACLMLKPRGLLRWYAGCCKTPIGNTASTPSIPFVGLLEANMRAPGGASLDELLGPVTGHGHRRFARGDRATMPASARSTPRMILRIARKILAWRLRGDHNRASLFDKNRKPVVTPYLLSEAERTRLYESVARS